HHKAGHININAPGAAIDHLSSSNYRSLTVSVHAETLCKKAQLLHGIDLDERFARVPVVLPSPAAFSLLANHFNHLLRSAKSQPTPSVLNPQAIDIERSTLRLVLNALVSSDPFLQAGALPVGRVEVARRVEEFMTANLERPLLTEDLCAEFDVS